MQLAQVDRFRQPVTCNDVRFSDKRFFAELECSGTEIDLLDPKGAAGINEWMVGISDQQSASACFPGGAQLSVKHLGCGYFGSWCREGDFAQIDGTKLVLTPDLDADPTGWYPLYVTLKTGSFFRRDVKKSGAVIFVRIAATNFDTCPQQSTLGLLTENIYP